jgi:hypothetical protein
LAHDFLKNRSSGKLLNVGSSFFFHVAWWWQSKHVVKMLTALEPDFTS